MLKFIRQYFAWRKRKSGKPVCDYEKGCGYYLPLGLISAKLIGREEDWEMSSGKIMRVKLISYKRFSDPDDMVESSCWQYLGYKGEKLFSDMTFKEFRKQ